MTFRTVLLEIAFTPVGVRGGCPAEKDNAGCFFLGNPPELRPPEVITAGKEFCDCAFRWLLPEGAHGVSEGKTLPAVPTAPRRVYPKEDFTVEKAARIPCSQVLGAYWVEFFREG